MPDFAVNVSETTLGAGLSSALNSAVKCDERLRIAMKHGDLKVARAQFKQLRRRLDNIARIANALEKYCDR